MRTLPRIVLLVLALTFVSGATAQVADPNQISRLTNTEVLGMISAGLSSDIVIAKIKLSRCNFDTEPTQLVELKSKGVPNEVLQAMIEAPHENTGQIPSPAQPVQANKQSANEIASTRNLPVIVKRDPSAFRNKRRFSSVYDKFKDKTRVGVGPFLVGGTMSYVLTSFQLEMAAVFFHKGRVVSESAEDFYLVFSAKGKDWRFLRSRDLYAIVDGERMELGEGERDSDVKLGSVSEMLIYRLSPDQFYKIATGHRVDLKIGSLERSLKDEHLEAFRDLYSLNQP